MIIKLILDLIDIHWQYKDFLYGQLFTIIDLFKCLTFILTI